MSKSNGRHNVTRVVGGQAAYRKALLTDFVNQAETIAREQVARLGSMYGPHAPAELLGQCEFWRGVVRTTAWQRSLLK